MRGSINLIEPIGEATLVTGSPVRGAGWYGPNTGLHSVAIKVLNFVGRVSVQATLAANPTSTDWFSVMPDGVAYWQYPRPSYLMTGLGSGETSTAAFNFVCNVVWVRALIDRSYIAYSGETPQQLSYLGTVDSILLNY